MKQQKIIKKKVTKETQKRHNVIRTNFTKFVATTAYIKAENINNVSRETLEHVNKQLKKEGKNYEDNQK